MTLKGVLKLMEIARPDTLWNEYMLLSNMTAFKFGPGDDKDRNRASHEVTYNVERKKFFYHSFSQSYHNGDYYNEYDAELEPTQELLEAIAEDLIPRAREALIKALKKDLEKQLERQAERIVKKMLETQID